MLGPLPTREVARTYPEQWRSLGLPDRLAELTEPLETTWVAVQLALTGVDQHTLARTLRLTPLTALRIIVAVTEQLVAPPVPRRPGSRTDSNPALDPAEIDP